MLPLLVNVEPSGRLLNVPAIGVAAVLLITVKTVPGGSSAAANIAKGKLRAAIDGDAVGDHLIGVGSIAVHLEL